MMIRRPSRFVPAPLVAALVLAAFTSRPAFAQSRLTLAEAIRLGQERSELLAASRAGESRADAELQSAGSGKLPQVSFASGYDRTIASQFSGFSSSLGPACAALRVDAAQPLGDRLTELERAASCGSIGGFSGMNVGTLPFGQRDVYQYNLSFSQVLYAGGRISSLQRQARSSRQVAALRTTAAEAQVALDVTEAFYNAALSDRLLAIAESGFQQAAATYDQTKLAFDAGRQPEFELLRAQVARDNQRPVVIRRRADRDVAYLRLRQLLELPTAAPLVLNIDLDVATLAPPEPFADALATPLSPTASADRVAVKQAEAVVRAREAGVSAARGERLPSLSLTSTAGQVGYPSSGSVPKFEDFRTNWTLGATLQVPLFTGRRLKAGELAARADLAEAQAELKQTLELAVLDVATAQQDLAAAEAVWQASAGTVQQAERAYQIAELRNREGLSTQLELSDSRLSLQVAQANRAQAARDVQVARARVALLANLPVGVR